MTDINLIEGKALEALRNRVRAKQEKRRKAAEKVRIKLESKPEFIIGTLTNQLVQANSRIHTLENKLKEYEHIYSQMHKVLHGEEDDY